MRAAPTTCHRLLFVPPRWPAQDGAIWRAFGSASSYRSGVRLFVYEYACAQPAAKVPASVRVQGAAMLRSVLEDAAGVRGVSSVTVEPSGEAEGAVFRSHAGAADATLVIAPEFDGC